MRETQLQVWYEEWDGVPAVRARGEIDLSSMHSFRSVVSEAVRTKPSRLIIDLREVTYIDSSGLGVLVAARRRFPEEPDSLTVITNQPAVLQALAVTGLDRLFSVRQEPCTAPASPSS